MTYDGFSRKTSMNDPDMGNWTYAYNAAGSLTEQRDANLARLCFTYDSLDRLQYKRHDNDNDGCESSDTQLAFYDYYAVDAGGGYVGRLKEIQWSASTSTDRETFAYDTLGRLTSHTRLIYNRSYTMSYSNFDALHRPTTVTYPNGQTAVTTYDREGANALANSGTNLISDIRYNGMGQLKYLQRSSGGIHTTYEYHPQTDVAGGGLGDSNFRLKTIQHGAAGTGNAWPDFTYEYDKVGNISKLTTVSTAGTDIQSFGYDHLNRLISASASGISPTYTDAYGYDKMGNLTNNDGVSQTYGSSSHVHAVTSAGGVSYSYDNNGNMTLRNASGTVNDYSHTFNVENELVSVVNNGNTTTFAYDASGIRVKAVAPNGTVTDYPFPGYEVESPTSNPTTRITFSIAGQAVALKVIGSSTATYYLYTDHLGSTSTMSTTAGGTVSGSTSRYYPFGDWRTEPTANLTDRGFTGHLHNNLGNAPDDIGLVYMQARWYLPGLGRFASADSIVPNPANPQSYNRYSYVRNSPLNRIDPTGHVDCGLLGDSNDMQACNSAAPPNLVNFTGGNWTAKEKSVIQIGAWDVAMALYKASEGQYGSPSETFKAVYGGAVTFHKTGTDGCPDKVCYGEWVGNNKINVYTDIYDKDGNSKIPGEWAGPRWAAHELGHGFEAKVNDILGVEHIRNNLPADVANRDGFAGPHPGWQQNECEIACNGEIYADMFVGWTYNRWEVRDGALTDPAILKANHMTTNMSVWIDIVVQR
ncbi:MAG: hypothetical protein KF770_27420 [Anaerolineae bacterium]|nr:hypothetical protein [Anaerolineae bacterium]